MRLVKLMQMTPKAKKILRLLERAVLHLFLETNKAFSDKKYTFKVVLENEELY